VVSYGVIKTAVEEFLARSKISTNGLLLFVIIRQGMLKLKKVSRDLSLCSFYKAERYFISVLPKT